MIERKISTWPLLIAVQAEEPVDGAMQFEHEPAKLETARNVGMFKYDMIGLNCT